MRWIIRATDKAYRELIHDEANEGRLPLAWLTFGYVTGHGWGFLHPWAQQAIFPTKGSIAGIEHPDRQHDAFFILRLRPHWREAHHQNYEHPIEGRYWYGLAWRRRWGPCWRARWALLDYDRITLREHMNREVRDAYGGFDPRGCN
jgi:hypothetical protein